MNEIIQSEQKQPERKRRYPTFGLLVLVLGVVLLVQNFFPQFDMRFYGPVALIIVGAVMVMRSRE